MPRWTTKQDQLLIENQTKGVAYCTELLNKTFRTCRSEEAVKRHANRIGISLVKLDICPECGRAGYKLVKTTNLCPICTTRHHTAQMLKYQEELKQKARRIEDDPEYAKAVRENARVRKANSRLCKAYGLPSFEERRTFYG